VKILKYFIESLFVYTFFLIIKLIGLIISRGLFSFVFKKVGPLIKSKKVIYENLEKILGHHEDAEKKKIISNMWSNYGMTFVEYIFLNQFKKNNKHITILGEKTLNNIVRANKPVIFVSGHFANFELMSMELKRKKIKLATIYRPLNNFFLNPFMEHIRRKNVCKEQIKKGINGIRDAIKYLNNGYSIALMVDQRVSEGKRIPFFNFDAFTTTLPAQIALKYKYDIVPLYIKRLKNNSFEMEVFEPLKISNSTDPEKIKLETSLKINKIIEKMILKDPSQWILTHNRWK
jgi:KDO2-lipid IV(A) lauroyltransferase